MDNRKLLWHGTNVAVVVAILKSGLRIMPHSGGRVGKGIYFASENGKSSGYGSLKTSLNFLFFSNSKRRRFCFVCSFSVGVTQDQGKSIGIMFLVKIRPKQNVFLRLNFDFSLRTKSRWVENIRLRPMIRRWKNLRQISIRSSLVVKLNRVNSLISMWIFFIRSFFFSDPKSDTTIPIDGKQIVVPVGKPIRTKYTSSSFSQSEYLIYKENQCRIRYLLKMQF